MIFALKAFMGERSHRQQFRGRHAIDEAKRNIEGILDAWRYCLRQPQRCQQQIKWSLDLESSEMSVDISFLIA